MMKKLMVVLAAISAAAVSQASVLLWQITTEDIENAHLVEGSSVTHASVYAVDYVHGGAAQKIGTMKVDGDERTIDISSLNSDYAFYVEVYNWNDTSRVLGTSWKSDFTGTEQTYTAMMSANYIGSTLSIPTLQAWHGGGVAAPEPTSGLLMLLGLAGLALKRRKA